jgi:hypothetical protein
MTVVTTTLDILGGALVIVTCVLGSFCATLYLWDEFFEAQWKRRRAKKAWSRE